MKEIIQFTFLTIIFSIAAHAQNSGPTDTNAFPSLHSNQKSDAKIVVLTSPGQLLDSPDVAKAIEIQLNDLSVTVEARRSVTANSDGAEEMSQQVEMISKEDGVAAVVWQSLADPSRLMLRIPGHDGTDTFERRIPESDHPDLQQESIAMICRATLRAVLVLQSINETPPRDVSTNHETPSAMVRSKKKERPRPNSVPSLNRSPSVTAPVDAPAPSTTSDGPPFVALKLSYAATAANKTIPPESGFRVGADLRIGKRVHLGAAYEFRQATTFTGECASMRVSPYPIALGADFLWKKNRLLLGPAFGILMVPHRVTPRATQTCAPIVEKAAFNRINAAVSSDIVLQYVLNPRIHLFLNTGVEIFLKQHQYGAADAAGQKEVIFAPWRVQPNVLLGIRVGVI